MPCSLLGRSCALLLSAAVMTTGAALAQDDPFGDDSDPFGAPSERFDDDGVDPFADSPSEASPPAPPKHALPSSPSPRKPIPRRMSSDADVVAALATRVDLKAIETPLADVAAELADKANINIDLDSESLEQVGIGRASPVSLHIRQARLKSVVNHMLRDMGLVYTVRGGALVITTPEAVELDLIKKAYPVDDLIDDEARDAGEFDLQSLSETIQATIEPATWEDVGGTGSIVELGKQLSIKQTFATHQQIEALLAALRKAHALAKRFHAGDRAPAAVPICDSDDATIRAALNKPCELLAIEQPLHKVVAALSDAAGVNILPDVRALEDVGIGADTFVTHDFRSATLTHGLTRVLRELDLVWEFRDDALVITTPDTTEERVHVQIFPLLDLMQIEPDVEELDDDGDYDSLIDLITVFVRPTTWQEVGGPSGIRFVGRGCLAISQTREGFAELDAFFAAYRRAAARWRTSSDADAIEPVALDDATHAPLRAALRRRIDELTLGEIPLRDLRMLSKRLDLPLALDFGHIEEAGIDLGTRVSATLRDEPIGVGLRRMLRPLQLTWNLHDGMILVTTMEQDADIVPTTRFYPVRDLLERPDDLDLSSIHARCDDLRRGVMSQIAEKSWEESGGAAVLELTPRWVMIVSQTEENHEAIDAWLDARRQLHNILSSPSAAKPRVNAAGEPLFDKVYKLYEASPNEAVELAEIVQTLVAPTSWRELDVYAIRPEMNRGAIAVRHTAKTHRQIHQLFCELGVQMKDGFGGLDDLPVARLSALSLRPHNPANARDKTLVVRVVRFHRDKPIDAKQVAAEVRDGVARDSWRNCSTFIRPFRNQLIIRQTPECQRQIEQHLDDREVLRTPPMSGISGGLGGWSAFGGF